MSAADKTKLDSLSTGAITSISIGTGLTGSTSNGTTTIKAKLKSETSAGIAGKNPNIYNNQLYAVIPDKDGNLAVSVPWENTYPVYTNATQNVAGLMSP